MQAQTLYHTFRRYRTLQTHRISALPIVILMPHSACNCRCVMCDIWKDNKNLKQLTESDITGLLSSLKKFGTQQVVMSGGEALLNQNFFRFCQILNGQGIRVSLLSTGLSIGKYADQLVEAVNDIIVSLDGPASLHDEIRNIPGAFNKLSDGIQMVRNINPVFRITGRTVIHRLNFRSWPQIIDAALDIGLDQISFLPADVSSQAFNRP
ncbi:MAG TPA: radical SAM protein, partial [Chitinophagaceae bacterium]